MSVKIAQPSTSVLLKHWTETNAALNNVPWKQRGPGNISLKTWGPRSMGSCKHRFLGK